MGAPSSSFIAVPFSRSFQHLTDNLYQDCNKLKTLIWRFIVVSRIKSVFIQILGFIVTSEQLSQIVDCHIIAMRAV